MKFLLRTGLFVIALSSASPAMASHSPYLGIEATWGQGVFETFPHALATAPDGSVYTLEDPLTVTRFDRDGNLLARWSGRPEDSGADIAVGASGAIYVTDGPDNRVLKYSPTGALLAEWDGADGTPSFNEPRGITADAAGAVYISQWHADGPTLVEVSESGAVIRRFGNGGYNYLARDGDGYLYGSVGGPGSIARVAPDGEFDGAIGTAGQELGQFEQTGPGGVAVAGDGSLWAADRVQNRIQGFTREGRLIGVCGYLSNSPVLGPEDVAASGDDLLVADQSASGIRQIQRIGMVTRPAVPCDALPPTLSGVKVIYRGPGRSWVERSSVRMRSSEPAHARFVLSKRVRRDGHRRWGRLARGRADVEKGVSRIELAEVFGELKPKPGPGRYRIAIRLRDEVGNRSAHRRVAFQAGS